MIDHRPTLFFLCLFIVFFPSVPHGVQRLHMLVTVQTPNDQIAICIRIRLDHQSILSCFIFSVKVRFGDWCSVNQSLLVAGSVSSVQCPYAIGLSHRLRPSSSLSELCALAFCLRLTSMSLLSLFSFDFGSFLGFWPFLLSGSFFLLL